MNISSPDALLDRALGAEDPAQRRAAFVDLAGSEHWPLVLAPHVISCQGYRVGDAMFPDLQTFKLAAGAIATDEDRVQRCLELAGSRFSGALLSALAEEMKGDLVETALAHLRTAEGVRAVLLQRVLQEADPKWLEHPLAIPVLRRLLRLQDHQQDQHRAELMRWLAEAGHLSHYVETLQEFPPMTLDEWSALGEAKLYDQALFDLAMATLPHAPAPLLYLLRLDPLPMVVARRVMASARGEWVASALEMAIMDGLEHELLVPLAEIGVRLGGRGLAAATGWIGASKLAKRLLVKLGDALGATNGDRRQIKDYLWIRRSAPSGDRALEQSRRGREPDPMDAATFVRQLRGAKVRELVGEILGGPREIMIESILHPLVAVNEEAAREVISLTDSDNPDTTRRAREVRKWADIAWPAEDVTQEIPLD
ncbi:MAG: hypothetical protein KAI47_22285 [Deltaproteobacteria bacterium]|nr:hypothetical protein [Deltaproteobacteria bacterium]